MALARAGRTREAIEQFRRALEIDDTYAKTHSNLGDALAKSGRWDEAIEHLSRAVELDPDDRIANARLTAARRQRTLPGT